MIKSTKNLWYDNINLVKDALKLAKLFNTRTNCHVGFDTNRYDFVLFKEKPRVEEIRKYNIIIIKDDDTVEPHWSLSYLNLKN